MKPLNEISDERLAAIFVGPVLVVLGAGAILGWSRPSEPHRDDPLVWTIIGTISLGLGLLVLAQLAVARLGGGQLAETIGARLWALRTAAGVALVVGSVLLFAASATGDTVIRLVLAIICLVLGAGILVSMTHAKSG